MGLKGCRWSSLNVPGTKTPLSHPGVERIPCSVGTLCVTSLPIQRPVLPLFSDRRDDAPVAVGLELAVLGAESARRSCNSANSSVHNKYIPIPSKKIFEKRNVTILWLNFMLVFTKRE